jgi:hypothetical protein
MQLKYDKTIKNKIISIALETTNFSPNEISAVDDLGDPVVEFSRTYTGGFVVTISKKLKAGFKLTQKFDGTSDLGAAIAAADSFYEDIKDKLNQVMTDLMDLHSDKAFPESSGLDDITNF